MVTPTSNGAPQSDLDFLNSLSTTAVRADVTSSSTSAATPDATTTTATSSPDLNDITQSLAFINLSRQLDASIPDSLASTQAAYDALLERKTPTPHDGQPDQDDDENDDENIDDADADEDDGLDERAILDLLNKMESADMAAQEFEGRLDKLLQGLDGMLESLGAARQVGAADEGTSNHSTAQDDVSPEPAPSAKKHDTDSAEKQGE